VRKSYQLIQNAFPEIEVQMFGDNINIISEDDVEIFTRFLKMNDVEVIEVKQKIPSIENVFIHLLREESLI